MNPPLSFNTAGPCIPGRHYMVPPLERLPEAFDLVREGGYFVIHAPRQSGKTTCIRALAKALTESGAYAALYFSCEAAEAKGDDDLAAQRLLVRELEQSAEIELPSELRPPAVNHGKPDSLFADTLRAWSEVCPRPVVLMVDEIDALRGQSLIAVLRQLRAGFSRRPTHFPWSVALCGLRDVRDYKAASGGDPERLGTASPFNVKVKSLRIGDFTPDEVQRLLAQHADATGQAFAPEAVTRLEELAGGQPWLVNALCRELVNELKLTGTITRQDVETAKERLILARATHLDSLVSKLAEPRVRRVIEPLLAGLAGRGDEVFSDDVSYVADLGLVKRSPLRVANPIYQEVIARVLTEPAEESVCQNPRSYRRADGSFDMDKLLCDFLAFWVEQGADLTETVTYREAAAQLVLMAFLQRVVNGGGNIVREYGLGSRRIDLLVTWPYRDADGRALQQREALELKVWRDKKQDPLSEGLLQLDEYLARLGLDQGTLVLFDRREQRAPLEQRTRFESATTASGRAVRVLRA